MEAATAPSRAATQIGGLRALADAIEADPEAFEDFYIRASVFLAGEVEQKPRLARIARALPGKVDKHVSDDFLSLEARPGGFPGVEVSVYADRDAVCERIVTGKRTVEREVEDVIEEAKVEKRTETVEEEIVEWRCEPLLGEMAQ